jgi:hypothetical protein
VDDLPSLKCRSELPNDESSNGSVTEFARGLCDSIDSRTMLSHTDWILLTQSCKSTVSSELKMYSPFWNVVSEEKERARSVPEC